jgi:hypothetical protein
VLERVAIALADTRHAQFLIVNNIVSEADLIQATEKVQAHLRIEPSQNPKTRGGYGILRLVKKEGVMSLPKGDPETLRQAGVATELLTWSTLLGSLGNLKASFVDYVWQKNGARRLVHL